MNIYILEYMNHFAVHLNVIQHCKSSTFQLKRKEKREVKAKITNFGAKDL